MRRLAVALAVLAAGIGIGGELVGADAPVKQGWWSKWQTEPATATTLPSPLPSVTVPAPPTGDDGGLTVAMGVDGPEAVAAMYFTVQAPVDGTLYLRAAPRKKEGTPGPSPGESAPEDAPDPDAIALPPGTGVVACQALSSWEREANGPWSRVPTWSNEGCVPGTPTADGTAMFWTLTATMMDDEDNYDIVLVPTGRPDAPTPFMVNFGSPGGDTLVTEDIPEPDPETTTTTEPEPTTTMIAPVPGVTFTVPPSGGVAVAPTVPRRLPPTSLVSSPRRLPSPFRFPDTRAERIMAVSLLLAMAGALWWVGGNPARMPRLIGAVGGRSPGAVAAPVPLRGVGRFARIRAGRAPRL